MTRFQRRVRTHVVLAVCSVAAIVAIRAVLHRDRALTEWSIATAYVGLGWLAFALVLGPREVLRNRVSPVSTDHRRDVGIWSAGLAMLHTVVGAQVHLGNPWLYLFREPGPPDSWVPRLDAFGAANALGSLAVITAVVLLATSSDAALRRLGPRRWKAIQRASYLFFITVVAHGAAYLVIERRATGFVLLFVLLTALATTMQTMGIRRLGRQAARTSAPVRTGQLGKPANRL